MPDFFYEFAKGFVAFVAVLESAEKLSDYIRRAAEKVTSATREEEQEKEPPGATGGSSEEDGLES